MAKTTPLRISSDHQANLELGLTDLNVARKLLREWDCSDCSDKTFALSALIERAGAKFEFTLMAAGILEGPGFIGTPADWLGIQDGDDEEDAS